MYIQAYVSFYPSLLSTCCLLHLVETWICHLLEPGFWAYFCQGAMPGNWMPYTENNQWTSCYLLQHHCNEVWYRTEHVFSVGNSGCQVYTSLPAPKETIPMGWTNDSDNLARAIVGLVSFLYLCFLIKYVHVFNFTKYWTRQTFLFQATCFA